MIYSQICLLSLQKKLMDNAIAFHTIHSFIVVTLT